MRHDLFVYDDDEAMLAKMVPFLESELAAGGRAVVVLDDRKRTLLIDALRADADTVTYFDRDSFYTRPEEVLARYDLELRQLAREGANAVRVFAELPRRASGDELDTWIAYEAVVNRALAHHPVWIMCGYDTREVPESLLEGAFETHPGVLTDDWRPSPGYRSPESVVTSRKPQPVPLPDVRALPIGGGPGTFRERLSAELSRASVSESEARDMVVAAGEVLANAQQHGGGRVEVRVGRVADRFVCEVSDDGPGIKNPLAGFLPPRPQTDDGAGLWVARQLTRQLDLVPTPEGLSVRLWAGISA